MYTRWCVNNFVARGEMGVESEEGAGGEEGVEKGVSEEEEEGEEGEEGEGPDEEHEPVEDDLAELLTSVVMRGARAQRR